MADVETRVFVGVRFGRAFASDRAAEFELQVTKLCDGANAVDNFVVEPFAFFVEVLPPDDQLQAVVQPQRRERARQFEDVLVRVGATIPPRVSASKRHFAHHIAAAITQQPQGIEFGLGFGFGAIAAVVGVEVELVVPFHPRRGLATDAQRVA